jgi:hypothetical protein
VNREENKVLKLKKALYGFKQAHGAWNKRIYSFLLQFSKCILKHAIYMKKKNNSDLMIIFCYVNDFVITCNDGCDTRKFKEIVKLEFNMTGLVISIFPWVGIHQNYKGNDVL